MNLHDLATQLHHAADEIASTTRNQERLEAALRVRRGLLGGVQLSGRNGIRSATEDELAASQREVDRALVDVLGYTGEGRLHVMAYSGTDEFIYTIRHVRGNAAIEYRISSSDSESTDNEFLRQLARDLNTYFAGTP